MNPTAIYALSLAGGGLTVVVGTVAYIARRAVEIDADRAAERIAEVAERNRQRRAQAAAPVRTTTQKELVR